jgi:hypothetical protein
MALQKTKALMSEKSKAMKLTIKMISVCKVTGSV